MTRKKELAILMALGMSRWQVRKSVLWEHAAYGVFGGVAGSLLSLALLGCVKRFDQTMIIVTHDMEVAGRCGRVLEISDGKIVGEHENR